MRRSKFVGLVVCTMAVVLLAACGMSVSPTSQPTVTPITLEPTDVLIELKSVPSGLGAPPVGILPCDLFPTFTLLADGSAYYIDHINGDWKQPQTMVAHLTPDEAKALIQRVLDLGFECLGSWTSECGPFPTEQVVCYDCSTSVLQVRLPDGELKTISSYGGLANEPKALKAILALLSNYQHPEAQPYAEKACLCFDPWLLGGDHPKVDWPQEERWLRATGATSWCQLSVDGSDLETLLTVTGRNRGFFQIRANGRVYGVQIVSWPHAGIECNTNVCLPAVAPSSP